MFLSLTLADKMRSITWAFDEFNYIFFLVDILYVRILRGVLAPPKKKIKKI